MPRENGMVFVSMIGNQVAVSGSDDTATQQAFEMLSNEVLTNIKDAQVDGDSRTSIRIRTVFVPIKM